MMRKATHAAAGKKLLFRTSNCTACPTPRTPRVTSRRGRRRGGGRRQLALRTGLRPSLHDAGVHRRLLARCLWGGRRWGFAGQRGRHMLEDRQKAGVTLLTCTRWGLSGGHRAATQSDSAPPGGGGVWGRPSLRDLGLGSWWRQAFLASPISCFSRSA